jgi:hypothetical protein
MFQPLKYLIIQNLSHPMEGGFSIQARVHSANRLANLPLSGERIRALPILVWEGNRGSNRAGPQIQRHSGSDGFGTMVSRTRKSGGAGIPS